MQLFSGGDSAQSSKDSGRKDRYRTMGALGKGNACEVFVAFDSSLNRIVAIKRLAPQYLGDQALVSLFDNETRLVSYLDHPGVITLFDTFVDQDGCPAYAMKLVEGTTLSSESGLPALNRTLTVFGKFCETLAYVHDRGIVHLDLTPQNVLLSNYGEVVVTGWGSARLYNHGPYNEYLRLVRAAPKGAILDIKSAAPGASAYQSPELCRGALDDLGPESDIFSLGVMLYQMITGRAPFTASDPRELAALICSHDPTPVTAINPEIPHQLKHICERMLTKEVFGRYHSFHELLHDLDIFYQSGQAFAAKTFDRNEVIFKEGEPGEFAFFVANGEVAIVKMVDGVQTVLARLGKDQIVGELALFTKEPRTATVVATQPGTVIRLMGRAQVEQELQKLSPWVGRMITGLSQRFNEMNAKLIALTRSTPAP